MYYLYFTLQTTRIQYYYHKKNTGLTTKYCTLPSVCSDSMSSFFVPFDGCLNDKMVLRASIKRSMHNIIYRTCTECSI